jgi:hypothetical protein
MQVPVAKEFTVKRSEWLRGTDDGTLRQDIDGKMCCLGFHALACGFSAAALEEAGSMPSDLTDNGYAPDGDEYYAWSRQPALDDIAKNNDSSVLQDSDRELLLRRQFSAIGITIHFED